MAPCPCGCGSRCPMCDAPGGPWPTTVRDGDLMVCDTCGAVARLTVTPLGWSLQQAPVTEATDEP
jgi:hypothetical protein